MAILLTLQNCQNRGTSFATLGDGELFGNGFGIQLQKNSVIVIDGFHEEAHLSLEIIASSFTEFLSRSIDDADVSTGGGGGHRYWSKPGAFYGETNHGR